MIPGQVAEPSLRYRGQVDACRPVPPPDAASVQAAPPRRWHPALAVPVVVLATLVVPPLGAALAFMARWDKAGRAVTVVLASIWFGVLLATASNPKPVQDDAKPGSQPVVTVTVTAPAPTPAALTPPSTPSATPAPAAPAPVSPSASARPTAPPVAAPSQPQVPQAPPSRPRAPAPADAGKTGTSGDAPAAVGSSSGGSSTSGGGGSAYYRNCTAVREAGAAPIRRGDSGFGSHLDRDGDGIACE
ncbi:excalibur calcium-binding domain-containing protein [Streptomyces sp. NPDC058655]|uniref:excalibur calcium-binding domain-containing protein n=1 Tax=Streptomyces sp. NPDC058655 TaxID=3346577 RepID=UPI00365F03E0